MGSTSPQSCRSREAELRLPGVISDRRRRLWVALCANSKRGRCRSTLPPLPLVSLRSWPIPGLFLAHSWPDRGTLALAVSTCSLTPASPYPDRRAAPRSLSLSGSRATSPLALWQRLHAEYKLRRLVPAHARRRFAKISRGHGLAPVAGDGGRIDSQSLGEPMTGREEGLSSSQMKKPETEA